MLEFEKNFDNRTLLLYNIKVQRLNEKLDKASSLLEALKPGRVKRGLINGLGSIIKSITGNLDYNDAITYDNAIKVLQNNQDKFNSDSNRYISLSKAWMSEHTKLISKLVENQMKINRTMQFIISRFDESDSFKYAELAQLLDSLDDNINDLLLVIRNIEDSLAFTRTSRAHHVMLGIDILRSMLVTLRSFYDSEQIINVDLREYYGIIRTGSYFSKNRIVIILRFPIITPHTYNLYKLSVLPNRTNHIIIPPYPYIATNKDMYVYIEAECPKLSNRFLCEETLNHHTRSSPDCIANLITTQEISSDCESTCLTLTKPAMEKLDDSHYTIIFPHLTKVELSCNHKEYLHLQGSFIATLPTNCSLRTDDLTIVNINNEIKGTPTKILIAPINHIPTRPLKTLGLHSINLQGLHNLQRQIEVYTTVAPEREFAIYHTTIPFYIFLLCAAATLMFLCYRRYRSKKMNIQRSNNSSAPEVDPAATFSLNVLK
ncbi:uncharacterized protein LOC123699919 [Colias croceus]|uniref:uncharacterized protein LOC123699919 n=1 Tax=Colias crocea TaxID=72248 RepID=UPI001E27E19D|nr:uncharacterized protein LOC123699919 [Colias croceus]